MAIGDLQRKQCTGDGYHYFSENIQCLYIPSTIFHSPEAVHASREWIHILIQQTALITFPRHLCKT